MSLPPLNQVVVSIEIVGLMRGEENANGGYINTIDITAVVHTVFLEVHVSYPTAYADHEKQNTSRGSCPSYAYTRQACTLRPDPVPVATLGHTTYQ